MESGNWCLLCHGCPSPCGDSAEFSLLSFVWCLSSWVLFSLWCFSDGALRYPGNALKSCVQELCPTNVFKNRCWKMCYVQETCCINVFKKRVQCKNSVQEASARNVFKKKVQKELELVILVDETGVQEDLLKKHVQKTRATSALNMLKGFVQETITDTCWKSLKNTSRKCTTVLKNQVQENALHERKHIVLKNYIIICMSKNVLKKMHWEDVVKKLVQKICWRTLLDKFLHKCAETK